jgi:vitamin B12 transporter
MNNELYKTIAAILLVCATGLTPFSVDKVLSQTYQFPVQVSGRVTDARTGEPVTGANIQLVGKGWGTITGTNGTFEFRSIPEDTYQLRISHVAYLPELAEITIKPGIPQSFVISLTPIIYALPEVNVVILQSDEETVAPTVVIDRKTIERSSAQSVGDLVANHSGLFVKEKGPAGSPQTVSIRGSAPNQILVFLDGQRLNTPAWGEVDLNTIPIDMVERVEIIRGSSPQYGGDASGGVIRIITKSLGAVSERKIQLGGGSFGYRRGQFYLSQQGNPALAFSASVVAARGDFQYTDRLGQTKKLNNADLHSDNLFWKAKGSARSWDIVLSASQYRMERGIPGDLDQMTPQARLDQRRRDLRITGTRLTTYGEISGLIYGGVDQAHHRNPIGFVPLDARHTEENIGTSLSWKVNLSNRLQIRLNHESRWDAMTSPSVESGNAERWSHGSAAMGQYRFTLPQWLMMPNLLWKTAARWDNLSDIGQHWTYQTGIFWGRQGVLSCHLRGNMSTALRPPTFTSLFWKEDAFARGNPHLQPEKSFSREIGAGISWSSRIMAELDITGFWHDIDDIILWRRSFDGRWAPYNVSRAEIDGVEVTTKLYPKSEWFRLEYSGTFLKPINRSGESNYHGKDLPYRPREVSRLAIGLSWRGWWTDYHVQWVSRRYIRESNSIPLSAEGMGPYRLMDLSVGKELSLIGCRWRIHCELKNLENREYRVVERAPMPGREWRASITAEFH